MSVDGDISWDGKVRLAYAALKDWVEAEQPAMEGDRWSLFCAIAGVDPDDARTLIKNRLSHPGEVKSREAA